MTKPGSTLVAVIMDRSGSMESVRDVTISGFNEFLGKQKREPGECNFYYTQFDDVYDIVHRYVPVADMPYLTPETYVPRNMTALYDAVGRTITTVGNDLAVLPEHERPSTVIFVIQTDGLENSSREYRLERIQEMIKHQTDKYGWSFLFLGASLGAMKEGTRMGMDVNSMMHYQPAAPGASSGAFASVSSNVTRSRVTGQSVGGFSKEDLAEFEKEVEAANSKGDVTSPPSE